MKTAALVIATLAALVWLIIGIGVIQQHFENTDERQCKVFNSSSQYDRWECQGQAPFYQRKN